jgi:hypothetical protein
MANRFPSADQVARLRSRWPAGSRVELVSLSDPYPGKLVPGSRGSVSFVDDSGTVFVSWDCGSSLGLVSGVDSFKPEPVFSPVIAAGFPGCGFVGAASAPDPAPAPAPAAVAAASVQQAVLASVAEVIGSLNGRLWVPPADEVLGLFLYQDLDRPVGVAAAFDEAFAEVALAFQAVARFAPASAAPVFLDLVSAFSSVAAAVAEAAVVLHQPGADDERCPVCGGSL